ncbi:MAG: YqgE/AlgH family protein [Rhodospirillales bacterium]|nr:YqgE/AlgH family protein [Rhodospirillales bacterium]MDP6882887.1 YqgE/AlgH family protein [Rhodospirillales bacterium]
MRKSAAIGAVIAALAVFFVPPPVAGAADGAANRGSPSLRGQFLVASPSMGDPRFARSVVYMVDHTPKGAMGFIVNRAFGTGPLNEFLKGFKIESEKSDATITIQYGGPVTPGRGFVLHTSDYAAKGTIRVTEKVSMTVEMSVLKDLAAGKGPRRVLFAMGYSGWGPRQLEGEMARDDWLTAPEDLGLIFDDDQDTKWERARTGAGLKL